MFFSCSPYWWLRFLMDRIIKLIFFVVLMLHVTFDCQWFVSDFKVLTWSRFKCEQNCSYLPLGWIFLIRYYTLKAVKRCTQIWAYLWATHKNSYSKWRCPQSWGYLWAWTIFTCKNLCSSHFFRNWLFSKVDAILRSVNTVAHFWALLLKHRFNQRNFAPSCC